MLLRKARKASNTWYRLGRPMITSGEQAGQRDQERIVVSIQIVPEDVFNQYGDRKVTGFTLSEIAEMVETGEGKTLWSNPEDQVEGIVLAKIEIGAGMYQVSLTELKQILSESRGKILSTPSPVDEKDRARMREQKDPEVKVVVVQGQAGPPPEVLPSDTLEIEAQEAEAKQPPENAVVTDYAAQETEATPEESEEGPDADQTGVTADDPTSAGPTDSEHDGARAQPE